MGAGNREGPLLSSGALLLCHASWDDGTVRLGSPQEVGIRGQGREGSEKVPFPSIPAVRPSSCMCELVTSMKGKNKRVQVPAPKPFPPACPTELMRFVIARGPLRASRVRASSVVLQGSQKALRQICYLPHLALSPTECCF